MESAIIRQGRSTTFILRPTMPAARYWRSPPLRLCINSALLQCKSNAIDGQHIRGNAIIYSVALGVAHDFAETMLDDFLESCIHFGFAPKISLAILHPLEITHRDPSGV